MSRITKPVEIRRQEIIAMARKLFVENGFDKTAVADITRSLNVAQGLAYYYFKSKVELLYAVIDEILKEEALNTAKIVSEHKGKAIDCLGILLANKANVEHYGQLFPSLAEDQALIEYFKRKIALSTEPIVLALIERGNKDGSWHCHCPEETAHFILHGIGGRLHSPEQVVTRIILRVLGCDKA
jgi:AcrR family transcriptional regulator